MEARGKASKETTKKYVPRYNTKQQRAEKYKKHLGSTSEGQGFADKRKKKIKYEYLKILQKEKIKKSKSTQDETHTEKHVQQFRPIKQQTKGMNTFSSLLKQKKIQKEKALKEKEETEKRRHKREEAMKNSRQKRKQNYKLLCKRTAKGQPVMKCQMEFLLAKIEKQINQT